MISGPDISKVQINKEKVIRSEINWKHDDGQIHGDSHLPCVCVSNAIFSIRTRDGLPNPWRNLRVAAMAKLKKMLGVKMVM